MGIFIVTRKGLVTVAVSLILATPTVTGTAFAEATVMSRTGALGAASDYVISPNDTLEIAVFQSSDLTRTVQVDSAGKVLVPLIGEVDALGKTPDQLSQKIAAELSKKYMKDPIVTVTLKDSTSQKVTVDGAVIQPGIYPVTGPTTLLQAVALAKGPDPRQANTRRVSVFRVSNDGSRTGAVYDLNAIRSGKTVDPPVYARDVIVVAGSSAKSFIQNASGIFPWISLLRPW